MRLQLNNFTQKLDFDVLWFRRRRAYKIQEEKKGKKREINLIASKSGLVGMKGYLETYYLLFVSDSLKVHKNTKNKNTQTNLSGTTQSINLRANLAKM